MKLLLKFYSLVFLESINQTMQQAKNEYPKNSYTPDMTILLKCINKQ